MKRFWDSIVEPLLSALGPEVIVEVGSATGENTRKLLGFCERRGCVLHAIDPAPRFDADALAKEHAGRLVAHLAPSLDALPRVGPFDVVLLDGDHNWHTVFRELELVDSLSREHPRGFPLVILHDVGWPYGRRDAYHDPDAVPDEHRQPWQRKGMVPGTKELVDEGGANPNNANATLEGGPKNGVLTAVEDFLARTPRDIRLVVVEGMHGLGILAPARLAADNPPFWRALDAVEPSGPLARHLARVEEARITSRMDRRKFAERARRAEVELGEVRNRGTSGGSWTRLFRRP